MKYYLVNVGVNSSHRPLYAPLLPDGRFEYVPIPQPKYQECPLLPTYADLRYRWLRAEQFIPARCLRWKAHNDPDFEEGTFGWYHRIRWAGVDLSPGNVLVFYGRLVDMRSRESVLAIIGRLYIERVWERVRVWHPEFEHLRNPHVLLAKWDRRLLDGFFLCQGSAELFETAVPFTPELAAALFPSHSSKIREMAGRFGPVRGLAMFFRKVREIEAPSELP